MRARWYRLALSPPRYVRAVLRDGQLFVFVVETPHTPVAWWQSFLLYSTFSLVEKVVSVSRILNYQLHISPSSSYLFLVCLAPWNAPPPFVLLTQLLK